MPLYHTMGMHSLTAMAALNGLFVAMADWDAGEALRNTPSLAAELLTLPGPEPQPPRRPEPAPLLGEDARQVGRGQRRVLPVQHAAVTTRPTRRAADLAAPARRSRGHPATRPATPPGVATAP